MGISAWGRDCYPIFGYLLHLQGAMDRIYKLLGQRESIRLEYKEAKRSLPRNLFETICAMLNREGGDVLLGVADNGDPIGVEESAIPAMVSDLVNLSNNQQKLDPPFILHPQTYDIEGKKIMHIAIPESSDIHKTAGVVYDRSNDGDFRVTHPAAIASLYNRKRNHYSEAVVYPGLTMADFKPELFAKVRALISRNNENHPWLGLDNEQLMAKAGLYGQDPQTKEWGYNLAAALLFGKDETILRVVSHYKIDALLRRDNIERYDDRIYIQCNLIEAYDLLMEFVERHLPDRFHLQGDQRISLRSRIFREVVANLIIHREYMDAHPTTFIIYRDRVEAINANNPHGNGLLLPDTFTPFPKNPIIAKFFIQLGRVDELGSGILNVYKYLTYYTPGATPQFIEDKLFKTIIPLATPTRVPLPDRGDGEKTGEVSEPSVRYGHGAINDAINDAINGAINGAINTLVRKRLVKEINQMHVKGSLTLHQIQELSSIERRTAQRDVKILKDAGLVEYVGSRKTGFYKLTDKALAIFKRR